ncbi:hypothetical protein A4R28_31905 (plasmid) [Mesorhizobium ciceri]|nr:hypothetical protein A4R28_31905 [Mesorhizobium ciceri]
MPADRLVEETFLYIVEQLGRRGVAYVHLLYELLPDGNMESVTFEARHLDHDMLAKARALFPGAFIWCGGFNDVEHAQAAPAGHWLWRTGPSITPATVKWGTRTSPPIRTTAQQAGPPDTAIGRAGVRLSATFLVTGASSKKVEAHANAVALHFMYYNFGRIHATLRLTPAMAAGVTGKLWEFGDIVALIEAKESEKPAVRGSYKKRAFA